jgi:hypothetical protein
VPKPNYYIYKCPEEGELTISDREKVSYRDGFKRGRRYGYIFVKQEGIRLTIMTRMPVWNSWGWTDWLAPKLEVLLREDLGL